VRSLVVALLVAAAAVLFASAPTSGGQAAHCAPNLANRLRSARSSDQLITVQASTYRTTYASLRLWARAGDGCFVPVAGPWTARLGVNGLKDRRREGDGTTPTGAYGIGPVMYGSAPNPGVRYRYHRVRCGDWWVEDPASPHYNTFQHVPCGTRPPFRTNPPGLWQDPVAYRHLAVIQFNMRPVVPGRGSAIFLHVSKGRPTAGCISLPLGRLLTTLRWLRPAKRPLIAVGTRETFRRL
jgi:L,D-peptidoglycan transpeptidase YkuD (ErfK/YbiS/YcfS/YnhG family)